MTMGYFRGNCGLVGDGDGGLGPRFRGDDEEVAGVTVEAGVMDGGWEDGVALWRMWRSEGR